LADPPIGNDKRAALSLNGQEDEDVDEIVNKYKIINNVSLRGELNKVDHKCGNSLLSD
jgi:hypothetical protein